MVSNATPPLPSDRLGRPLGVLRLSLTARCNLACPYCQPDGVEPPELLNLEQGLSVIAAAVELGAFSLRLTGGEPLLHAGLEELVAAVQPLRRRGLELRLTEFMDVGNRNGWRPETVVSAAEQPQQIHLAHDGERRQPLLGVYPSAGVLRADLSAAIQRGARRLQGWLAAQDCREVVLDPAALRNVNRPEELAKQPTACDPASLRPER